MESVLILGRQAEIGLAELQSLYGNNAVKPLGDHAAVVSVDPCLLAFDRLGGSMKFAKLLNTLDTTNWNSIIATLAGVAPGHSERMPEGKMRLGLSLYGFNETPARIQAGALQLKKAIKKTGRNVRVIPNQTADLNTAQVIHNQLTGPNGWELLIIKDGSRTVIAQTIKVQNITAYAKRDQERPARDAKVGMLPPKLAQIIINLASGPLPKQQLQNVCDIPAGQPIPRNIMQRTLLDPFCGTGVVLQEALLMGYDVLGADIDQRMVTYSNKNIDWLRGEHTGLPEANTQVGDATSTTWDAPVIDLVACETYLGRPFTSTPSPEILNQTVSECNLIIKKFLQNAHAQLQPGTRLCLAVPAWYIDNKPPKRLPLVDQISNLGYNQVEFEQIGHTPLVYRRPDQIVARELLVITRK